MGMTNDNVYASPVYARKSEVIELSKSGDYICNDWVPFPNVYQIRSGFRNAIGGLLGANPVVCGGNSYTEECYILTQKKSNFLTKLSTIRNGAAIVQVNSSRLWISGGFNGMNIVASSEFLQEDGTKPGPELPKALQRHIMVNLNNLTMVIGGQNEYTKTFVYDHQKGEWSDGPNINEARYFHAGGIVTDEITKENFIVISGGIYVGGVGLNSTEVFFGFYWSKGERMITSIMSFTKFSCKSNRLLLPNGQRNFLG